jgi:hypothetical protein
MNPKMKVWCVLSPAVVDRNKLAVRLSAGAHTADPGSIQFFNHLEVDYLCVDPHHITGAIVAAAQAHIRSSTRKNIFVYVLVNQGCSLVKFWVC